MVMVTGNITCFIMKYFPFFMRIEIPYAQTFSVFVVCTFNLVCGRSSTPYKIFWK